jgi:type 1 fimbria pilin
MKMKKIFISVAILLFATKGWAQVEIPRKVYHLFRAKVNHSFRGKVYRSFRGKVYHLI